MTPKQTALRALEVLKGDNAERARRSFRGMSEDQMNIPYGQSNKTKKQILEELEAKEKECQDAIDWVNKQPN